MRHTICLNQPISNQLIIFVKVKGSRKLSVILSKNYKKAKRFCKDGPFQFYLLHTVVAKVPFVRWKRMIKALFKYISQ